MAINKDEKLTKFKSATTVVTADFANSIYGGLRNSAEGDILSADDPRVIGHVHDGVYADGHAEKISLKDHVKDQLPGPYIANEAITKRTVRPSIFQDEAIPISEDIDGQTYYYIDTSSSGLVSGPSSSGDNSVAIWDGTDGTTLKDSELTYINNSTTFNYSGIRSSGINSDIIISSNGTGAIQRVPPDATIVGGDQRGLRSIDLQLERLSADQVASGNDSVLIGGYGNKADGTYSGVISGLLNSANGSGFILSGVANSASNPTAFNLILGGSSNINSGTGSTIIGTECTATANYSIAIGRYSVAGNTGQLSHAAGRFANSGDAQYTRDLESSEITGGGAFAFTTFGQIQLTDYTTYYFSVDIVAREAATGDSAVWNIRGGAKQDNGTGTSTLLGVPNALFRSTAGAAAWDAEVSVAPAGFLSVRGSSDLGTVVSWLATMKITRINRLPPSP